MRILSCYYDYYKTYRTCKYFLNFHFETELRSKKKS